MRYIISLLTCVMLLFIGNIIAYLTSEDYRFFLKKIKYSDDIVYDQKTVDDTERYHLVEGENIVEKKAITLDPQEDDVFFLTPKETIGGGDYKQNDIGVLGDAQQHVLDVLRERFVLREQESIEAPLFGITQEYPDVYREYVNTHMSLYIFPTKTYKELKEIFEVLRYDLPISLNEVNNFAQASTYINMRDNGSDTFVRIIFQYENMAFGLKIKKDSYNSVKDVLKQLR